MYAFILAAILTPPDLISQIGLGIPIIILLKFNILSSIFENEKNEKKTHKKEKDIYETDFNQ